MVLLRCAQENQAASGFEPLDSGFADHRLTTWLRRRKVPDSRLLSYFYLAGIYFAQGIIENLIARLFN